MLKMIRNILITLTAATLLILVILYFYNSGRTYFNDEDEIGNTTGNIYNGGLFCEQDGKIYFSNDNADGSLYVMNSNGTGFKKIKEDKAVYINADENYLYYVRANNTKENIKGFFEFNNTGVYRIRQNGTGLKAFTGDPGAYLLLSGNNVYFQKYDVDAGLYLYQYQIDTTMERCLVKDAVIPCAVIDHSLYYAGYSKNHNLNTIGLSSFTSNTVLEGSYLYPIFANQFIYYMDISDNYRVYRMNQDGSEPTRLVDKRCSTYNITNSGKYLYFQVDNNKSNGIYRLDLETKKEELLKKGNYKQINVTENYVFFKDFDNTHTYIVSADGSSKVKTFKAPKSSAK